MDNRSERSKGKGDKWTHLFGSNSTSTPHVQYSYYRGGTREARHTLVHTHTRLHRNPLLSLLRHTPTYKHTKRGRHTNTQKQRHTLAQEHTSRNTQWRVCGYLISEYLSMCVWCSSTEDTEQCKKLTVVHVSSCEIATLFLNTPFVSVHTQRPDSVSPSLNSLHAWTFGFA